MNIVIEQGYRDQGSVTSCSWIYFSITFNEE